ncbi:MAG: hypothetical protein AB2385_13075 [Symbiobacterium sp.]|uniref:hypothetical protein n=1 Tax=Symbiobacterium sp. TaxID=1971213 RepID=UPI003464DFC2
MNLHPDHVRLVVEQRVSGYDRHAVLHRPAAEAAWHARCRAVRRRRWVFLRQLVLGLLSRFANGRIRRRFT